MLTSKMFAASQRVAMRVPIAAFPRVQFSDKLKEKEIGEEKVYFSKQDANLLKNLMSKLEAREKLQTPKHKEHDAACDDLDAIFKSHGFCKNTDHKLLYQELMEWKRTKHGL